MSHPRIPARSVDGAFTLIELLATVGIVVLLAAVLTPALNRGLERAKQSACLGKMKQLGAVCYTYASDNQNELPGGANVGLGNPSDIWVYKLGPYLAGFNDGNSNVLWSPNLKCPSNKQFDASGTSYGPVMGDVSFYGQCAGGLNAESTYRPSHISDIPSPSKTPYWVEINNTTFVDGMNAGAQAAWQLPAIHLGGSNVLMADGHIIWVRADEWTQSGGTPHPWAYHFALAYPKPSW